MVANPTTFSNDAGAPWHCCELKAFVVPDVSAFTFLGNGTERDEKDVADDVNT